MGQIKLMSHARPASPHNTTGISYYGGKVKTVVVAECEGVYERPTDMPVHYRDMADCNVCAKCGGFAAIWHDSEDRWASHPARCQP